MNAAISFGIAFFSFLMAPFYSVYSQAGAKTIHTDSLLVKKTNIDIIGEDGAKLKGTYYSPGRRGPGMLLLHQCNMDRKSWETLGIKLAQQGIHVITFDYRGYGDSPKGSSENLASDIDAVLSKLLSTPGVDRNNIALGGASCGVNNSVQLARRSGKIKALLLLSGPTTTEGLEYLHKNPGLAIFGAASSEEDLAVRAIKEMVATSSNPASTMKELHNAGHGVPMFTADVTLQPAVVNWLVSVLK